MGNKAVKLNPSHFVTRVPLSNARQKTLKLFKRIPFAQDHNLNLLAEELELDSQQFQQPLRSSSHLRELAEKALLSLEIRAEEEVEAWAKQLAEDVAGAVD